MRYAQIVLLVAVMVALGGCAGKVGRDGFTVNYTPNDSVAVPVQGSPVVFVVATDARGNRSISSLEKPTPAEDAAGFLVYGPLYALIDSDVKDNSGHDVTGDFSSALSRRLADSGVLVDSERRDCAAIINLVVNRLRVDFRMGTWTGEVGYTATVRQGEETICEDQIHEAATAWNWNGLDSGQKALNEAFTNAINKFDLNRCLSHLGNTSP